MDTGDRISRLERLADLLGKGVISDAEFADEKRKLFSTGAGDEPVARVSIPADGSLSTGEAINAETVAEQRDYERDNPVFLNEPSIEQVSPPEHTFAVDGGSDVHPPLMPLWKLFFLIMGILLISDAMGSLRGGLGFVGLLLCGAAFIKLTRPELDRWLPPVSARWLVAVGASVVLVPLIANIVPPPAASDVQNRLGATPERGEAKNSPQVLDAYDGASRDSIHEEPSSKISGRTSYLSGCRTSSRTQTGFGECLSNMDGALKECDIFRLRSESQYEICLRQMTEAYDF